MPGLDAEAAATASTGPASTSARACGPIWPTSPTPRSRAASTSSSCAKGAIEAGRASSAALEVLAEACARHGALLAVNDRADVALAAGADVLHLGQDDLPVRGRGGSSATT